MDLLEGQIRFLESLIRLTELGHVVIGEEVKIDDCIEAVCGQIAETLNFRHIGDTEDE